MMKKQLIMEKATELFAKQGFEATSVQQITEYCGISKGAFYLSFKSKDELILALIDQFMMEFTADIDRIVRQHHDDGTSGGSGGVGSDWRGDRKTLDGSGGRDSGGGHLDDCEDLVGIGSRSGDNLLYHFYYAIFDSFQKHSDFGKILIKEQSHSFNKELFGKISSYDRLMENLILTMIERLYGDEDTGNRDDADFIASANVRSDLATETGIGHSADTNTNSGLHMNRNAGAFERIKYDLMFCIKGFMNTYSQLFLFYNLPLDLDLLARSLVEKTNLLAKSMTVPFFTKELAEMFKLAGMGPREFEVSQQQMIDLLEQKTGEVEESIAKESMILLREQLLEPEPTLSPAIVMGLIENLRNHPHCKWMAYLLGNYWK